ncbi:hypothetical protein C5167_035633 [Papaver somniferum]|uniref:Rhodanese domain-containing protein n=1 Tax=Papaver somniferum TaxID=3469 RepID=A0A4Y7KG19_PAPSO|nr:rhodanese-like domain-containing protein 4, chloroplastic [Papaver somniferum]RZC70845.1 hypothetical protein C5167_035633 [Papaver somniferum]
MEALNASSLTPVSVLSDRRTKPRKASSLLSIPQLSFLKSSTPNASSALSKSLNRGLVALSSVLSSGFAKALTYEEALQQSVSTDNSDIDFDIVDNAVKFVTENPAIIIGGFALLGLPLVLSQVFSKKPKAWGLESAKNSYSKLAEDGNAQLLDIRAAAEIKKMGSPDIRGLKKKPVSIVYRGDDKPGFLKKLSLKFKEPENTTLLILDKFDGNSELVAELVTVNGFKAAYAIKDGAEGTRGWMSSGLPWIEPKKTLSFEFGSLTESFSGALGETSEALSLALGVAAATGLGLLAFTEVETILQLLGSAALVQFVSKKLLFAENRKETLQQVDEFLTTKVAPKELVGEIQQIGLSFLPSSISKKALPAPEEVPNTDVTSNVLKTEKDLQLKPEAPAEGNSIPKTEFKAEAELEAPTQSNSAAKTDAKAEPTLRFPRPLSPYASYPDLKPPTSPSPSQP